MLAERSEQSQVVDVVGTIVAADPFHEGAHRMLMTALAASGRRYEALATFDRLREALAGEYAADPEPATRRLYRDLLTGEGAAPRSGAATAVVAPPRPDRPGGHASRTVSGRSRHPLSVADASWPRSAGRWAGPDC